MGGSRRVGGVSISHSFAPAVVRRPMTGNTPAQRLEIIAQSRRRVESAKAAAAAVSACGETQKGRIAWLPPAQPLQRWAPPHSREIRFSCASARPASVSAEPSPICRANGARRKTPVLTQKRAYGAVIGPYAVSCPMFHRNEAGPGRFNPA
jgi:hypothetical protein